MLCCQTSWTCASRFSTRDGRVIRRFRGCGPGLGALILAVVLTTGPAALADRPLGIDVSSWCPLTQSEWNAIRNSGRVFAFARASYGWGGTDSQFVNHTTRGTAAGLYMGAYHFSYPGYSSGNTPINEANTFLSMAGPYITGGYLLPVLDVEYVGQYLGGLTLTQWCIQWLDHVEQQTGVRPLVYCNLPWAQQLDSTIKSGPDSAKLWWAAWWSNPNPQTDSPSTDGWSTWSFWQYAGDVPIPGVTDQAVDLNVFHSDQFQFQDFVISGGTQPPTIIQQPVNRIVVQGGSTTFTVVATGGTPLSYQWQKNQANWTNGGHYSGCTTPTLTVANCDSNDAASYRCVVTNPYGNATSNEVTLTITTQPTTFIVESRSGGQNFGNYTETAGWYDAAGSVKSTAAGCTAGIGSRYCVIGATPVSAAFSFTPAITGIWEVFTTNCTTSNSGNPLIHKVTHAGGTANVGVCQNTTCSPNAVNVWYSLGQHALNSGALYSVTLDGSTGAGSGPSGNAGRSDAIKWELITPSIPPPTITQQPSNQNVCPNSTAMFIVAATGQGTLSYQWQKNQVNITNGGHYSGCTTTTLTVSNASSGDTASYRCAVTNEGGTTYSNAASLMLRAATTITQHPANQNICPGGTATFTVAATGDGTLSYQWQKNQANITNGGHYSGCTTTTLTVSSASSGDATNYRCVVTGGCGSGVNSNSASLTLRAATAITGQPQSQTVAAGANVSFSVTATGDGTLTYQWLKGGANVTDGGRFSGATSSTLQITNTVPANSGSYACLVTGGCGSATSSAALLTVNPLTPPGDFDHDGDVDQEDFAVLQKCLGVTNAMGDPTCGPADLSGDNTIDYTDVLNFEGCRSGAEIAANINCISGQ